MWHLGGWDVLLSSVVVFGSQKDDLSTKRVSGYQLNPLNPLNPLSGPTHFGDCDSWAWGAGTCSMPYYMICHQILSLNIMWFHVLDILYFCSFSDGNTTRTWCESDTKDGWKETDIEMVLLDSWSPSSSTSGCEYDLLGIGITCTYLFERHNRHFVWHELLLYQVLAKTWGADGHLSSPHRHIVVIPQRNWTACP